MSLRDRLSADLKDALRARDEVRLLTIRSLTAALQSAEIARREGGTATLTDDDALAVLTKQAKQRREAIAQFEAAGRADLAAKEQAELAVIDGYLPRALSDDEIRAEVEAVVRETGAEGPAAMGKVMGPAMARLRGRADGGRVQAVVRAVLGGA